MYTGWKTTTLAPFTGSMAFVHFAISCSSRARNALRFCSKAARFSGATRASPSTMFCVITGASPGSREKCGLPCGWTSPIERSTRVVGTSSTSTLREMSTRPRPPRMMVALLEASMATSAQVSRPRPFSTTASARRSLSIMLGRTSASWKFCVPRVRLSTSTRSPPTASVSDFRSGMVATTFSLRAACTPGASITVPAMANTTSRINRFMRDLLLEAMGGMGAQDERGLEEQLVDDATAAAVGIEAVAVRALGVLVGRAEPQELRREEAHVRLDGPLAARHRRILRVVVAGAERPLPPRLHLGPAVPAEAVLRLLLERIALVAGHLADRIDALAAEREQRMQPAVGPILVLDVVADQRALESVGRDAVGDRGAHLQPHRVGQLEERHHASGRQRRPQAAEAEGGLVVAVE